jgi:mannose-6-phosphate isomerase-like protein (cupin superfamily)
MKLEPKDCFRLEMAELRKRLPTADGKSFVIALERGALTVELFSPYKVDLQQPHDRDECYVVVEGSGRFQMGDETAEFKTGDFLFVPAGVEHRFLDFGETLTVWVIFYGPVGGEQI